MMLRSATRHMISLLALVIMFCVVGYLNNNKNAINDQSVLIERFLASHSRGDNNGSSSSATPMPGDFGSPVTFGKTTEESIGKMIKMGFESQGLNQYASDLVSVHRRLPDIRAEWCKEPGRYLSNLPETSVVIVFYNEAWSVLVRTVHSVLDRSPPELIREIVLVDDFSFLPHLKTQLQDYFLAYPKVKIVRAEERLGLMRARLLGAKTAEGEVLTFLDAHVECTEGWLEALLDPVARNWTTISIPTVDWIDEKDMHLRSEAAPMFYGAYDWDLNFGWWARSTRKNKPDNIYEPFDSPAMSGGLFTITRRFFEHVGWYDEGFEIYGIENIELSMKSWMCGGKMVTVPCSRVGHIAKAGHPYMMQSHRDYVRSNSLRLAEVWMDEYKQVIFDIYGIPKYPVEDAGEVCMRKEIRKKAQCKSFKYYVTTAFPEMHSPAVKGWFRGEMKNKALGSKMCLQYDKGDNFLGMRECNHQQTNQYWTHNYYDELNSRKNCLDYIGTGTYVGVVGCHRSRGNQGWENVNATGQFRIKKYNKCLELDLTTNNTVIVADCDVKKDNQFWMVEPIDLDVSFFSK
ncbi:putative polypeptide N-acetylgalactosaminyltransferase 9 [Uranotaenia lowii]|uniref:putative polypeptide N-acetylgalactosaminyltransferase 9 n=1 Tax=Uranotaenia lowii TaxID=190385 RepID=UPI0024793CFE|nr:putative polypeptide N-acetylgalactosaminyltransferase 9 [Uranotaenia lowii]